MEKNLAKTYNPKDFEDRIYEMWEQKGAFRAEVDKNKKPYTIVMPPPNITGQLHLLLRASTCPHLLRPSVKYLRQLYP